MIKTDLKTNINRFTWIITISCVTSFALTRELKVENEFISQNCSDVAKSLNLDSPKSERVEKI